jgi:hypothetical protein
VIELFLIVDGIQVAVDAGHGIAADFQVQVGCALFDSGLQQVVNVHKMESLLFVDLVIC